MNTTYTSAVYSAVHEALDHSQYLLSSSDPQQPRDIYFLVPFKVGLFGIMNEAVNKQVTYVIPESVAVSKVQKM